jgi:ubiquinone/menaquinone biosynthesis C-methylase UbiE
MFKCSKCKSKMNLPVCKFCGFEVPNENNIWRLTDAPDVVTEGDGDKYIGFEYIGESYSGNRKYIIEERDLLFAEEISRLTGNGIFLDLACGDGCFTVPCASFGTKIIAGDISCTMLSILQKKAEKNNISLENVTLCRMNALDIPLEDETVQTVVANSVLHLFSNPEKVIKEIYRVLKKGGAFICKDVRPREAEGSKFDNEKYNEIVNSMYKYYWDIMTERGIMPTKRNWEFNRDTLCDSLFEKKTSKLIERGNEYELPIKDWFLPRFVGKGFSEQVNVPKDLHEEVINYLLNEYKQKYGDNFVDIAYKGVEEDILVTIYTK